jgi:hypothetical protein
MADERREDPVPKIVYRRQPAVPGQVPAPGPEPADRDEPKLPTRIVNFENSDSLGSAESDFDTWAEATRQRGAPRPDSETPPGPAGDNRSAMRDPAGRGPVVWGIFVANLAIAAGLVALVRWLSGARAFEVEKGLDVTTELDRALVGFDMMTRAAMIAAGGFALSGLAVVSMRRIGWFAALAWALATAATIAGAVYGIPAIVLLLLPSTRDRYFRSSIAG